MVVLWNIIATIAFFGLGFVAVVFAMMDLFGWLVIALLLLLMAILRWGLIQKKYAQLHTALLWGYIGIILAVWLAMFIGIDALWKSIVGILLSALLFLMVPNMISEWVWNARLRRAKPAGWNALQEQSRAEVLRLSPFLIEAVTSVTETRSGGVVQDQTASISRYDLSLGDSIATSPTTLTDAEDWILDRYRAYRKWKRLPIALSVGPDETVSREEKEVIEPFTSVAWESPQPLSAWQVLEGAPYLITLDTPQGIGVFRYDASTDGEADLDALSLAEQRLPALAEWKPAHPNSPDQAPAYSVRLAATGRIVARFDQLAEAEAEIQRRYVEQRALDGRPVPNQLTTDEPENITLANKQLN